VIGTRLAARPRRRLSAAVLAFVLCVATTLAGAAATALAAKPKPGAHPKVVILAPHREARVAGKTLRVRVRASATTGLHATVSGIDVTRRFHRAGGMLEATLRRGRDFRSGENTLAVAVGKGRVLPVTAPFVAVSRDKGLLKVSKIGAHGRRPLGIEIRSAAPLERLRVAIDGHRYPIGSPEGQRRWTIAIGASDGAHYGRNTVEVLAEREGSPRFDQEKVHFKIGRGAPLAGAGPDLTTRTGRAVTLRGGSTKAGSRKGALIYRWEIVQRPPGSHARIANGTSRNARLLPDLPGPYKVRLTAARVSKATAAREDGAKASASAVETAAKPTCLEAAPTPLTPAKASSTPSYEPDGSGPFLPLNPLESPPCVTPIGEPTTPALPLEATKAMSVDETVLTSLPTESPMGWPIETLAGDGSTRVGRQVFPKQSGWVRMLVLGQKTLTPVKPFQDWPKGEKVFQLNEGPTLLKAIEKAAGETSGEKEIFVLTGMGIEQPNPPLSAEEDLAKAISLLGIPEPEPNDRGEIVESGNWSVIGTPHQPGRGFSNLHGLGEQPVEGLPGTLPGSLNGRMQNVLTDAYSYVTGEAIPFDTKAAGSSSTVNVIEVGGAKATSTPIVPGALGLHIAVYDIGNANGLPTLAANYTDTIDNPFIVTNYQGVEAAAKQLEQWRVNGENYLIVMQTVGEEGVGPNTAPWRSKNWVNDALIPVNQRGLLEWHNQAYLKAKNEAELAEKQDLRWNPGYPTVAGQVGDLTGEVGHDLVSIFGGGNPQVEVSRLTMLAENHPESVESSYVNGYSEGPGRLTGILVRNARGGLQVENASAIPLPTSNSFRELAFSGGASGGGWKNSTGKENEAALAYFAKELWPSEDFKTPREAYVSKANDPWTNLIHSVEKEVKFEPGKGFEKKTFREVKEDLETEMNDLAIVQKAIGNWKDLLTEKGVQSFVNAERIGAGLVELVERDAKLKSKAEGEVDVEGIISESLYIASDLAGFGEDTEFLKIPEIVSVVAGGFGVAEAATPEGPEEAEGPNSNLIRAKGTAIGAAIVKRFNHMKETLGQFEAIFASSWPKLQKARIEAKGPWSWGHEVEKELTATLATSTERAIDEALLPMAYTQWVVSPYFTKFDPAGPQVPGNGYECIHFKNALEQNLLHPFKDEPAGALSTAVYRPFEPPGSTENPAQPYTQPYTIRALKSEADPLEVFKEQWSDTEDLIEVHGSGKNPPASLINPLFKPLNSGETEPSFPVNLGINKTAFYAGYGEGPTEWKRMICAQG
jgi:hypothetical protein